MTISDRIRELRRKRGISQEELAEQLGISRQAVSKWESGQSMPDLDKIILLSDYFDVTTDYLLKGIQPTEPQAEKTSVNASVFAIAGTALNAIGLATSCGVWYEEQDAMALVIGLIFMAMGCMIFGIGMVCSAEHTRPTAKSMFWKINIWILYFLPLSMVYNILTGGLPAPYPLRFGPFFLFRIFFWLIYFAICLLTELYLWRSSHKSNACAATSDLSQSIQRDHKPRGNLRRGSWRDRCKSGETEGVVSHSQVCTEIQLIRKCYTLTPSVFDALRRIHLPPRGRLLLFSLQ